MSCSRHCFNSRTREGCDRTDDIPTTGSFGFNSRTREGCDSVGDVARLSSAMFQFTHPGGVRLLVLVLLDLFCCVSIHAPGRGATPAEV